MPSSVIYRKLVEGDDGYVNGQTRFAIEKTTIRTDVSFISVADLDAKIAALNTSKQTSIDNYNSQILVLQDQKDALLNTP